MAAILPQNFYARDALHVARDLLGKLLCVDQIILRITETEAYGWPFDSASHCYRGRTARNSVMFGPPGHAYVYLCYGLHNMLNIVTNNEDEGSGVLIRSCEIYSGFETILKRRGPTQSKAILAGPGNVGRALGIDRTWNGHVLYKAGGLEVRDAPRVNDILIGPRVGIDYAETKDRLAPFRFADARSIHVTQKKNLN